MKGDKERCLEVGMDAYVAKPIDPSELFETMNMAMHLRELGMPMPVRAAHLRPNVLGTKVMLR